MGPFLDLQKTSKTSVFHWFVKHLREILSQRRKALGWQAGGASTFLRLICERCLVAFILSYSFFCFMACVLSFFVSFTHYFCCSFFSYFSHYFSTSDLWALSFCFIFLLLSFSLWLALFLSLLFSFCFRSPFLYLFLLLVILFVLS